ncbi:glycosyltransferase family 2 protein [Rhodopirellula sp. JC639]|uniref:glycosyltransferase family 2 protein n=1 Tax=Stieleria mannarensis TaxID=2755585 RepID=UPI0016042D62|nr:glycosyltransferase family 2 protein [Rhodopirellula sp. JC639]
MSEIFNPAEPRSSTVGIADGIQPDLPTLGPADVIDRVQHTLRDVQQACRQIKDDGNSAFDLSVIVPVYNERETLPKILERIDEVFPQRTQTVVIDDASSDGTTQWLAALAPRANRTVLLRGRNHGKGSAVRMGLRHSRGEIVAIQDADTEYDPVDLLQVIKPIQSGQAEVVYGSRYLDGSDDPSLFHRLGNWALTAISNCMTGQQLTDMETCHKAFRGDLVRSIRIRECRFGFEPEITGKIADRGVTIAEVPTGYQYRSYDEGKKITWKDGVAALACMWRYRNPGWLWRAFAGAGRVLVRLPRLIRPDNR